MALIGGTTQEMTRRDTGVLDALGERHAGPIGTVGYCMGGGRPQCGCAYPTASLRRQLPWRQPGKRFTRQPARRARIKARVYVGMAGVDRSFPPEQSARLAEALRTAEVDHIIENYVGMQHGWAVSDHSVYDEAGAERHWKRLTKFFGETLG